MIYDRNKQHLLLEGKAYTPEDISKCVAEGAEKYPPAIWDLFLFLSEWFNDSPVKEPFMSVANGCPEAGRTIRFKPATNERTTTIMAPM